MFVIKPGIYHIPNFGKLDTRNEISTSKCLELYENNNFPFIKITEDVIAFLKKEKLSDKRLIKLIEQAQSSEEILILMQVKTSKKIKSVADKQLSYF